MGQVESPEDQNDDPASLAEICIRELVNRAGFNNIAAVLYPLLKLVCFFNNSPYFPNNLFEGDLVLLDCTF